QTALRKRGGKAFHSVLESRFGFIHQQRQRLKTWQEIVSSLFTKKGIRVTLYAPLSLSPAQVEKSSHRENSSLDARHARPSTAANRPQSQLVPLPMQFDFKRPNLSTNTE